ncbi:hypothetical protein PAHAL_5G344800 [Panicum hallii]|uniref:Uncharacterized protein n=1 Tax=Panicum hallii TaxID=206008 RepID=A0A2T8IM56_9POAL|nr:hypothetical protein PAHAL_5G344800 [Panicum hallii]
MIRDHRQLKSPAHTAPTSRRPPSSAASRGPGARHPPPTREAPGTWAPRSSPRPLLPAPPAAPHDPPLAPHVMPPPTSAASRGPGARHPLLLARHLGRAPRSFRRPLLLPATLPWRRTRTSCRLAPLQRPPAKSGPPPGMLAKKPVRRRLFSGQKNPAIPVAGTDGGAGSMYGRWLITSTPSEQTKESGHAVVEVITFHFLDLCLQQDDKISYRMDQ